MKPKHFFIFVLGYLPVVLFGQQVPQYTMNMLDKYRHNPAYGGMDASLSITGALKSQWEGVPGAPGFESITAHLPFYIANGGAGFQFFHDEIGVEEALGFQASYNYVFQTPIGLISAGMAVGLIQKKIDGSRQRTPDGIYEGFTIIHNDPILSSTLGSGLAPLSVLGIYFTNDFLEAGISADQVLQSKVILKNEEETTFLLKRTLFGFVEYTYNYDESLQIYPSIFMKSDGRQFQVDLSARFEYQSLYSGGLSFRGYSANTIDALALFAGVRINHKLQLSYAYDITLSKLRTISEGTHEVVIHYNLSKPIGVGRPERVIYNPRY